jgi:hypothetical protein
MPSNQAKRSDEPLSDSIGEVTGIGVGLRQQLWKQMARECQAMAQLALHTGRTIPVEVRAGSAALRHPRPSRTHQQGSLAGSLKEVGGRRA